MKPNSTRSNSYQFAAVEAEMIKNTESPTKYYDFQVINTVVESQIGRRADIAYYGAGQDLIDSLTNFKDTNKNRAVISLHIGLNGGKPSHFVGLYIQKLENGFEVTYIDPTGLDTIPANVAGVILQTLGVQSENIIKTTNMIQHYYEDRNGENRIITNVHCGAFVADILTGLAIGNVRIDNGRLQREDEENHFVDIGDFDEHRSDAWGELLREKHLKLLSKDIDGDLDSVHQGIADIVPEDIYNLTRSDSGMSNYTDLLSEIMDDQIGEGVDFEGDRERNNDYELFDVKTKNPKIDEITTSINAAKKPIREEVKKTLEKKEDGTPKKNNRQCHHTYKQKYQTSPEIEKLRKQLTEERGKIIEDPLSPAQQIQKMHLFRGKALNSKKLDRDGNLVERDPKEIRNTITSKHKGNALKSDGLIANPEIEENIKNQTRKYLQEIKAKESTAIFNSGKTYDSAVADLMSRTGAMGNTVVATSKFPWVAAEYEAGNMGGAAGGNRAVAYGYDKTKKPVNRVLGNGYAMSIKMQDYVSLRQGGDLVDVNVDMGKGTKVNQMIEEVTFNSEIPGEMVAGNLPMVLPRFDRDYDDMTEEKQRQYKRVFNLDKEKYNKYRGLFDEKNDGQNVPLGEIVEHLIMHHGFLLREIAIKSDRDDGYQGNFLVGKNELFHSSLIEDVFLTGENLAARAARKDNAKKRAGYELSSNLSPSKSHIEDDKEEVDIVAKSSLVMINDEQDEKPVARRPSSSPSTSRRSSVSEGEVLAQQLSKINLGNQNNPNR